MLFFRGRYASLSRPFSGGRFTLVKWLRFPCFPIFNYLRMSRGEIGGHDNRPGLQSVHRLYSNQRCSFSSTSWPPSERAERAYQRNTQKIHGITHKRPQDTHTRWHIHTKHDTQVTHRQHTHHQDMYTQRIYQYTQDTQASMYAHELPTHHAHRMYTQYLVHDMPGIIYTKHTRFTHAPQVQTRTT